MSQPSARPAETADIPHLVALMHEFYTESAVPLDHAWATRAFHALLTQPALGIVWALEVDGAVAGYVVLTVRFAMEFGGPIGCVDDLFVRRTARRRGAAGLGLETLRREGQRRGCLAIEVEVARDDPAAQALYRRHGFEPLEDGRQILRALVTARSARTPGTGH